MRLRLPGERLDLGTRALLELRRWRELLALVVRHPGIAFAMGAAAFAMATACQLGFDVHSLRARRAVVPAVSDSASTTSHVGPVETTPAPTPAGCHDHPPEVLCL